MWNAEVVTPWTFLRRLLALLVIAGLALAPLAASAVASPMTAASTTAMAKDMMPCCSGDHAPQKQDCDGKAACPMISVCAAKCFQAGPTVLGVPAAYSTILARLAPRNDAWWAGRSPLPPARPPRS